MGHFTSHSAVPRGICAFLLAAAALLCACIGPQPLPDPDAITFAVIGGTAPESPFGPMSPWIDEAVRSMNADSPVFILHTGDIVYGGESAVGIKESDIARQFNEFKVRSSGALPNIYTVRGDLDTLDGSPEMYQRMTGRGRYYSFNYGNLHFIVLDTTDPIPGVVGGAQMRWLEDDLAAYADSPALFVFTHHPVLLPQAAYYGDPPLVLKNASDLIALFARHRVKAVFSGHMKSSFTEKKDGILYVTAGCGNFNERLPFAQENQYYLVRFSSQEIAVTGKKLKP
ncbi:MAG: hypothetical protein EPN93_02130 [Spirochaetes bacterium]|nr:MAG: hypothetical protein EPN93_02130 [Spirochaetota bacterium]